jgi:Periplasmic binding protein
MQPFARTVAAAGLIGAASFGGLALAQADEAAVKIGVLTDMAGIFSGFGGPGSVVAATMAVEDFGGRVLGKQIEIVSADHQNKPDIGLGIARRWYDVEGVDAIFDVLNSGLALPLQTLTESKNRLVASLKQVPVEDFMTDRAQIRADGRLLRNMYFGEVKAPTESKSEFDFVNILSTIPGDAAFRPAAESECPALKN